MTADPSGGMSTTNIIIIVVVAGGVGSILILAPLIALSVFFLYKRKQARDAPTQQPSLVLDPIGIDSAAAPEYTLETTAMASGIPLYSDALSSTMDVGVVPAISGAQFCALPSIGSMSDVLPPPPPSSSDSLASKQ